MKLDTLHVIGVVIIQTIYRIQKLGNDMIRFFGTIFLLCCLSCSANARAEVAPENNEYYAVIFSFTLDEHKQLSSFRLNKVINVRSEQTVESSIVPAQFIDAARETYSRKRSTSSPVEDNQKEMSTYYYFNPATPDRTDIDPEEIRKARALDAEPLSLIQVDLLQPEAVIQNRVPSTEEFASYISNIKKAVESAVKKDTQKISAAGFLVIALKPNYKSNVWLDFTPPLPADLATQIVTVSKAVRPINTKQGVVAFSMKLSINGGADTTNQEPFPKEWKNALDKKMVFPVEVEALVKKVWPD